MSRFLWSLLFSLTCIAIPLIRPQAAMLVKDGQAAAVIAVPAQPDEYEKLAVQDLTTYLTKMSGAKLEVKSLAADELEAFLAEAGRQGLTAVVLGKLALPRLQQALGNRANVRGAFALQVGKADVFAAGHSEGTYYAVLELLERLGCRWFMPGDLGEVVPLLKTVNVKAQTTAQAPSFPSRWYQEPDREWQMRVRCGGDIFGGGHGIPTPKGVAVNKQTGEIEPAEYAEFFALVKGKRTIRQHCVSNPQFIEYVLAEVKAKRKAGRGPVLPMGPNPTSAVSPLPPAQNIFSSVRQTGHRSPSRMAPAENAM
jgi:hypothetical protein